MVETQHKACVLHCFTNKHAKFSDFLNTIFPVCSKYAWCVGKSVHYCERN